MPIRRIDVVGPGDYDDVVVEIDCSPAFTAVVRNENKQYLLEVFNFDPSQIEEFNSGYKSQRTTVELEELLRAIEKAKALLAYQSEPKESGSK